MISYYIEYITGPKGVIKLRRPDKCGQSIFDIFKVSSFVAMTLRRYKAYKPPALRTGVVKIRAVCWRHIIDHDRARYVDIISRRLAFKRF